MKQPTLFDFDEPAVPDPPADQAARDFAVDPQNDVVLEASAGTGKTRVLVDRYVNLLAAGVDPRHILAITFTRKAAAEMRDRVLTELARRRALALPGSPLWAMVDRVNEIQISTIDAFCFALLREFPLEAGVDPAFDVADETEMARFAAAALDETLAFARSLTLTDESVRLLLARVKAPGLRAAIASLLDRRTAARQAVAAFVARGERDATSPAIGARFVARLRDRLDGRPDLAALVDDGPDGVPEFQWFRDAIQSLPGLTGDDPGDVPQLRRSLERYLFTLQGTPRKKLVSSAKNAFSSDAVRRRHEQAVSRLAAEVDEDLARLDRDLDHLLARGFLRLLTIASSIYERLLGEAALLDFGGMLNRSVALLERQEEFARSRLKLQARYHHVLVDEFQDTSRAQWRLVELLIEAWAEGEGPADAPTSIFIVGDRKQSIYRFRQADVTLLDLAARRIAALRRDRPVRQSISTSFRAVPELLAFVNALSGHLESQDSLPDRFTYGDQDRFPVPPVGDGARRDGRPVLGLIARPSMAECAAVLAAEVERLLENGSVRDRERGVREVRPDDIAVLFRSRAGYQYYEDALDVRGVRTYVYKGLGFFDAPEVQDLQALLGYVSDPLSDLRAAAFLRSRFLRLSDVALARLAPGLARVLLSAELDPDAFDIPDLDRRVLARARAAVTRWMGLVDRLRPSELVDLVIRESAYAWELSGRRLDQARENVKKVRSLLRRVENRGYATVRRLSAYFETLRAGDDSNAIVEASGAVNLMTMHAAKGLEFPIVFLVNLHVGARRGGSAISVVDEGPDGQPEVAFRSNDATRLEDRRENEELRRLLYVAVTRARDRLYLASEVDLKSARVRTQGRSLAGLFPSSLAGLFVDAATTTDEEVVWQTPAGNFAFGVCRPSEEDSDGTAVPQELVAPQETELPSPPPWPKTGRSAEGVTGYLAGQASVAESAPPIDSEGRESLADRSLVGTLVHRLFQRQASPDAGLDRLEELARGLLRPDERGAASDAAESAARAAKIFQAFALRPDVRALIDSGTAYYEVPFSYAPAERPDLAVRGAIDCLVVTSDTVTVVEFKTGVKRPEHERQAALYQEAARQAFGRKDVLVQIFYA